MLYIAETGDGKQKFRNRLFVIWFNTLLTLHLRTRDVVLAEVYQKCNVLFCHNLKNFFNKTKLVN